MIEINNTSGFEVDIKNLQKIGENFLDYYKKSEYNVSLAIINDGKMTEINHQYRGKNKTTDVLSFESSDEEKENDKFLGEILISFTQIKKQAEEFGKSTADELNFIFVHGLLHLLGYTDETDESRQKMIDLGNQFLQKT